MSTSNFATFPASRGGASYGENLGRAALDFVAALFAVSAVRPSQAALAEGSTTTADLRRLYRLAAGGDSVRPQAVAALKAIAERI